MANTYVALSLSGAVFADGSTLSGTWSAEYDDSGNLVGIINPDLVVTGTDGTQTTFTSANNSSGNGAYQLFSQGNGGGFYNLYLDWNGENPATLSGGGSIYTSIVNPSGQVQTLGATGTVANVTSTVASSLAGAEFADGSTLQGTWTAVYDGSGTLVGVENASFTVTGPQGSTTFTEAGTLPYADTPSSSSYEIHFLSSTDNGGGYQSLYVDWKSENPSSLYEGTPSLYTSVINTSDGSTTPVRLIDDGTTGQGSTPVISGLPTTESGTDAQTLSPFAGVGVTDAGASTASATIVLSDDGGATDNNGALAGTGVTRVGVGTYQIAAASLGELTEDLQSVGFTPTAGASDPGTQTTTRISIAINDSDGSSAAATSVTITATCFLSGTMIATPHGEAAIETLREGDVVSVLEQGRPVARTVVWAGRGHMDAARFGCPDAAFPVRIRRHAFADGIPARDLLVTPEHCILTEAGLTPARMLVNGASVLVDRDIARYDIFHVELASHGILLAEGLATESYLDTGNRLLFGPEAASAGRAGGPSRMAAPLAVARAQVEPVWQRLAERAAALGLAASTPACALTGQPDLRVLLENGVALAPCATDNARHMFRIPAGLRPVRLLSRSSVPASIVGPFVDDRRRLGVQVEKLVLWAGLTGTVLPAEAMALPGWHSPEGGLRWTDGDAGLDLPALSEPCFVDVHLSGTTLYPMPQAA